MDTDNPDDPKETSPRENDTRVNQPLQPNPPGTPTPPPGDTLNATRAQEHMTLQDRFQMALRHIHTIQGHNARLYEDNCRLVNGVNTLNDRLTFLGAPQNIQLHRFTDIQEKLRLSEANRALISRKYQDLLQSTSAASVQRHIFDELQAVRDAYTAREKEYFILADKYARLKAVADPTRVPQQLPQSTGDCALCRLIEGADLALATHAARPMPAVHPEFANTTQFRAHDQSRNSYASPTSATFPSFQPFQDQRVNQRRHSSEGVMAQPSLRSGPTPIATTWLAHLPTPPRSAPLPIGQMSPTGFPVHAPVPAGSLPLPHHPQLPHDSRSLAALPPVTHSQRLVQQSTSDQINAAMHPRRRSVDVTNKEPPPHSQQIPTPAPLLSSPRPPKRPNNVLQASVGLGGEYKKPRMEAESDHPTTIDVDKNPTNRIPSPLASAESHTDHKTSVPDSSVRSYQDCVNLIFEKDADVENGVFCGLCFDRHQANMIPEPPDVLVQPDFDFLLSHCMTEHPTVWNDLRHKT